MTRGSRFYAFMWIMATDTTQGTLRAFVTSRLHQAIGVGGHGKVLLLSFIAWQKNTDHFVEVHTRTKRTKVFPRLEDRIALEVATLANAHLQGNRESSGVHNAIIWARGGVDQATAADTLHMKSTRPVATLTVDPRRNTRILMFRALNLFGVCIMATDALR